MSKLFPKLIFILLVVLFLINSLVVLLDKPAVWPDEAIYSNIARNFITRGQLATDLWGGLKPGADQYAAWNPPVFFLTLSVWLMLFGYSIVAQRLLSVVFGLGIIWLIYLLTPKLVRIKHPLIGLIPILGLVIDFHFVRGTRLSRPDIQALFLIIFSIYLSFSKILIRSQPIQLKRFLPTSFLSHFITGILMGLAILTHPIAICFSFIPLVNWYKPQKSLFVRHLISYFLGALSPIIIWLLLVWHHWHIIWQQLSLAAARKGLETPWIIEVVRGHNIWLQVMFLLMTIISILYLLYVKNHFNRSRLVIITLLATSWFASIFGRQLWYTIYLIPFLYLAITDLINTYYHHKDANKNNLALICLLLATNFIYSFLTIYDIKSHHLSYFQFAQKVQQSIPDGSAIFLSAIPDPYFGLAGTNHHYTIYEFPDYQAPLDQYTKLLHEVDYVVYTGSQEQVVFGNFLANYLSHNTDQVISIGQVGEYQAQIHKLVPSNLRQPPTSKLPTP